MVRLKTQQRTYWMTLRKWSLVALVEEPLVLLLVVECLCLLPLLPLVLRLVVECLCQLPLVLWVVVEYHCLLPLVLPGLLPLEECLSLQLFLELAVLVDLWVA